jgi:hypothetical protein
MVDPLLQVFPDLSRSGYSFTSPPNRDYNCIAWAAGDIKNWWWPVPPDVKEVFWPVGVTRAETLSAFQEAFASLGYIPCAAADLEQGFEKIALFANEQDVPLHAARQLNTGRWTSKVGELEDIEHALHDMEGIVYGSVVVVMKRPFPLST